MIYPIIFAELWLEHRPKVIVNKPPADPGFRRHPGDGRPGVTIFRQSIVEFNTA